MNDMCVLLPSGPLMGWIIVGAASILMMIGQFLAFIVSDLDRSNRRRSASIFAGGIAVVIVSLWLTYVGINRAL